MIKALRTFRVRPSLPDELAPLLDLAHNLRWSWRRQTQELFRWVDADLWEEAHGNPVLLLGRLSPERVDALRRDGAFLTALGEETEALERYLTHPRWAQGRDPAPPRVAYFSPEFGLTHTMQVYSGGLGILAGDHLKAASDLGLDLVGVGLLYRAGYFSQYLDASGWQRERYPDVNPYDLPLTRLERDGRPALVEVDLAGRRVACQVWRAQVGRVPLLLLDTDVATNDPADRAVTDRLYGGDTEHRIRQEIVLGIGGVRALRLATDLGAVGGGSGAAGAWEPELFHSNEGHAGFLQLERIRELVADGGSRPGGRRMGFDEAIEAARARVLFTTHTPVPAGIDVFPRELMARYFTDFAATLGVTFDQLMAVGDTSPDRPVAGDGDGPAGGDRFNMAMMGLRLSAAANGVSQLHGRVSRSMFNPLWPRLTDAEVPITSITNGVHAATWVGREMAAVYDRHLPPDWRHNPDAWGRVGDVGDDVLWRARERARERMVTEVRRIARAQAERRGETRATLRWADEVLDPDALTIGFARRFALYKRGNLLLSNVERLHALVASGDRPVQFVFAGKAHPRDDGGKDLIRQVVRAALDDPVLRGRIVFLEDYDMDVARVMYAGCDVWLNNPRRPYEACGTSGMKAVLNGALHCSTLDGWWDEMYDGENGFAIGTADETDQEHQDAADAQSLYDTLEQAVVPIFHSRGEGPLPRRWLARVRRSLATLAPRVLASRMVGEYADALYVPLAQRADGLTATADGRVAARARDLAAWKAHVRTEWSGVAVEAVAEDESAGSIGERRDVRVEVDTGALTADDLRVELLHGRVRADGSLADPNVVTLERAGGRTTGRASGNGGSATYTGAYTVDAAGEYGVAVRVVPSNPDLTSWADVGLVTWAAPEGAGVPGVDGGVDGGVGGGS